MAIDYNDYDASGFGDMPDSFSTDSGGGFWDSVSSGLGKIDWGGLGSGLFQAAIPGLASLGTGFLASKIFPDTPGKQQLIDPRTTEQQQSQRGQVQAQQQGLARMTALQQNPMSFGLPGDPNDPNTPAGRRRYDITKSSRAADAARGSLNTGGSANRELIALNQAIGDQYNQVWGQAANLASMGVGGPSLQYSVTPGQQNPWGKLVTSLASPVAGKAIKDIYGQMVA